MGDDKNILERLFARGNSYWLTRFVILRLLGFVYAVAFLVAANQLVPLIGEHGLTPATHFLAAIQASLGSKTAGMIQVPTLFWLGISDSSLSILSWVGFALSLVVLAGYANAIILAILWAMYMSIVHIGQIWYGYGWEIQLLETGFLSIFLCPLLDHDWGRFNQIARRSMLARSHVPLLSLRNAANPEPDQPVFPFFVALAVEI
jgi:hypothetical protein